MTIRMLLPGQEAAVAEQLSGLSALPTAKCLMGMTKRSSRPSSSNTTSFPGTSSRPSSRPTTSTSTMADCPSRCSKNRAVDSIRMSPQGAPGQRRGRHGTHHHQGHGERTPGKVLKRADKVPDVDPWEVGAPRMEMRRYKRKVNVLNPATMRVYTVRSLCESSVTRDADASLLLVEIEYKGTMLPHMARRMAGWKPRATSTSCSNSPTRAAALAITRSHCCSAASQRSPTILSANAPARIDRIEPRTVRPAKTDAEAEVVADIAFLRQHLEDRYAYRNTRLTKRKWLKATRRSSAS